MYIWTKRQFVQEMLRLTDVGDSRSAVVINHTHNQLAWSPSHGQTLPPSGYRNLFETIEPRVFAESRLLADIVGGRTLDLSRHDDPGSLDADPALTLIASREPAVFAAHPLGVRETARGEFRVNPLYQARAEGEGRAYAAPLSVRRLRAGVRRLPPVSAGRGRGRPRDASRCCRRARPPGGWPSWPAAA